MIVRSTLIQVLFSCFIALPLIAQAPLDTAPQMGLSPSGLYTVDKLETIDRVNGNVMYRIPLAMLPKVGSEDPFQLQLVYNSQNLRASYNYFSDPRLTAGQFAANATLNIDNGWSLNTAYGVTEELRPQPPSSPGTCTTANYTIYRLYVTTPDGGRHYLSLYGYTNDEGYYAVDPIAGVLTSCGASQALTTPLTYFTDDSTYIKVVVTNPGGGSNNTQYQMFLPNGSVVNGNLGAGLSPVSITDRNGNITNIVSSNNQTVISNPAGSLTISGFGLRGSLSGPSTQTITSAAFGGTTATWTLHWSAPVAFNGGATGTYTCTSLGDSCSSAIQENMLTSVDLPSPSGTPLSFQFAYNTMGGWGNLSQVTYPSGAVVKYAYKLDNTSTGIGASFLSNPVIRKEVDYTELWDGNSIPHADVWTFNYLVPNAACTAGNIMTAPDQGVDSVCFTHLTRSSEGLSGAIYKHVSPIGDIDEKAYATNVPPWGNGDGGLNPEVAVEAHALSGTNATVITHTYDENGNETAQTLYDFGQYSSLPRDNSGFITGPVAGSTPLRSTATNYSVAVPSANTGTQQTADNTAGYWYPTAPVLLHLVARSVVSGLGPGSATEQSYDTNGNVTEMRRWDSIKAAALPSVLTANNSVVQDFTYSGRGNVLVATDGRSIPTQYVYDSSDLFLTQKTIAYGTPQAETFSYQIDPSTALLGSRLDQNGIPTVYQYDSLGRLTQVQRAQGTGVETDTSYTYDDVNQRIIRRSDQNQKADGMLVSTTVYDPLGRVSLAQQLEQSATQSATDVTAGIKIQSRYIYGSGNTYKLTSNPFREATSSAAGAACAAQPATCAMGWTVTKYDTSGRVVAISHYDGSGLPAPWGGNTNTSGTTTTVYNAQFTTVTDEAGNVKQNAVDGAGRLVSVVEDPTSLNYSTTYSYDALDSLTLVNQSGQTRRFSYNSLQRLISATNPESGTVAYSYDANGNLTGKTDSRNIVTTYLYDPLNRLYNKTYTDGTPSVSFKYDTVVPNGHGYLASVSNSSSTTNYLIYDELGRVKSSNQQTAGRTFPFSYDYNLAGSLTSETYPSGRTINTAYDGADRAFTASGQLAGITTNYVTGTTYQPHGAIAALTYPVANANNNHTLTSEFGYDNRLRMSVQWVLLDGSSDHYLFTENASYFGNDNLSSGAEGYGSNVPFTSLTWFTQNYTYDKVNRLATANDNGGWSRTFGYDPIGNLSVAPGTGNTISVAYSNLYDPTTNRIKNPGVQYDAAGNQIVVNGNTLAYDAENRQFYVFDSVTKDSELYLYGGDGRRVAKQDNGNGTGTVFVYDAMGQLAAEYFTPVTSNPCTTCYLISDRLGSTRLVTDTAGNVVSRHDYLPFGEEIGSYSAGRTGQWGPATDNITQKFTGKERDSETGLDYFGARYFGSALGRFTSPDPLGGRLIDPQTLNRYAYVRNNPLSLTDPTGLYIVNCTAGSGKDQKNCNKAADRFETQQEKDLKSKDIKVSDAAKAWGNRGEDNHVNVTFKSQQQVDADANTQPGYKTDAMVTPGTTSDHQPKVNAEFSEDLRGKDLAQTIAHEGSHIEDDMNFLKSYDPATGQYFGGLNFTHFDTEFQAFGAGSMVKPYTMFPRGPSGYQQLTNYIYRAYPNADQLVFPPSIYPQGNPPQ